MSRGSTARQTLTKYAIPVTCVAGYAEVPTSDASEYLTDHYVSKKNCVKIEKAIRDITEFIEFMETWIGVRPDLRNADTLREHIHVFQQARAERQLAQAESELTTALKELAAPLNNQL